jgi:hypothetical protein
MVSYISVVVETKQCKVLPPVSPNACSTFQSSLLSCNPKATNTNSKKRISLFNRKKLIEHKPTSPRRVLFKFDAKTLAI